MFKIAKINTLTGIAKHLDFQEFIFPAGEVSVKLNARDYAYKTLTLPNTIIARIQNSDDLFKLALFKDAVARFDDNPINLFLAYVPYSRQDRVCCEGESFSIMMLSRFLNSLGFSKVTIVDPHSGVTPACLESQNNIGKIEVISQLDVLNKFTQFIPTLMSSDLVSPDSGANKKTSDVAAWLNKETFIRADKLRDLSNGKIKEIAVYCEDLKGQDVVICDDISEMGGTFIGLAKVLKTKNVGKVILYVTHGIFGGVSEREKVITNLFANGIDEIWTTDSYHADLNEWIEIKFPNLHVLNIENLISF